VFLCAFSKVSQQQASSNSFAFDGIKVAFLHFSDETWNQEDEISMFGCTGDVPRQNHESDYKLSEDDETLNHLRLWTSQICVGYFEELSGY
jgi:hypothetical protein